MTARALMLQGTSSHAGKSLLTAALSRAFSRRGLRVVPFKPQNMSNNAAVTVDGGEIGRAQALQARAAGLAPMVAMNPVLLKPESETGAQVVVRGRVIGRYSAEAYHRLKPTLLPAVMASFAELAADADLVLVEGAGSPAEANLRDGDIANMGFARAADVPVVLIGDVERGGVLAQLVGTMILLEPADRDLVRGYVVNKFRGDPALFDGAHPIIRSHTGLPSLGVVTWCEAAAALPQEDVVGLAEAAARGRRDGRVRIVVPRLPRIANVDDLDPLLAEPLVDLRLLGPGEPVPGDADLVLLPGSKSTLSDLAALRREGWDVDILAHARRGGRVLGLCGGYQMLGRSIADPDAGDGTAGSAPGLGLLAVDTVLDRSKVLGMTNAIHVQSGLPVAGYEIHLGRTVGPGTTRPLLRIGDRRDGAVSADGRIAGCYLHGLLAADGFRSFFLDGIRPGTASGIEIESVLEGALDELARHVERCLDLDGLLALARPVRQ